MIARIWKGWTKLENADGYEEFLKEEILPELSCVRGCLGVYILRSISKEEVEFVVETFFDSVEAVRIFAGPEYETPVIPPKGRQWLSKAELVATHYEVRLHTSQRE